MFFYLLGLLMGGFYALMVAYCFCLSCCTAGLRATVFGHDEAGELTEAQQRHLNHIRMRQQWSSER